MTEIKAETKHNCWTCEHDLKGGDGVSLGSCNLLATTFGGGNRAYAISMWCDRYVGTDGMPAHAADDCPGYAAAL